MEHSTATPVKAKKTPSTKGKTQVGRPDQAANETLPLVAWALPMQEVMRKLENLAADAAQVEDVTDGSDTYAHRIDNQIVLCFKNARVAVEQGKHSVETVIETLFDAQALVLGAKAVDVGSPNREARHDLILGAIDAVINCQMWEGLDDAELALVAAGIPAPNEVPAVSVKKSNEGSTAQQFITPETSLLKAGKFARTLMIDCVFDVEGQALQLVKYSRDLDVSPEEASVLRGIGIRIATLNAQVMSYLGGDQCQTAGNAFSTLYGSAVKFPEGVAA